ncbi:MAG: hypothetical protein IJN78_00155 [Clostridia bacterium]|nr:hypothetical protein [Clostridia bacterium]MBQ7042999.1 hypothetical protein [Clostridia bacterium]
MLTAKEVREKKLQDGKDFIFLGKVRYQEGESFKRKDKDITVKKIIDPHHFITNNGESWHTGMFNDFNCIHGKNMIPLEYNESSFRCAVLRLTSKQVFNPDVTVLRADGKFDELGECMIRYDKNKGTFSIETLDYEEKNNNLFMGVQNVFGHGTMEVIYALQEWGESGEQPIEILIDDENCTTVKYEGVPHTVVEQGLYCDSPESDTLTLLKRHSSPSQNFVIVKNLKEQNGEYVGETLSEEENFTTGLDVFYSQVVFAEGGNGKKTEAEL